MNKLIIVLSVLMGMASCVMGQSAVSTVLIGSHDLIPINSIFKSSVTNNVILTNEYLIVAPPSLFFMWKCNNESIAISCLPINKVRFQYVDTDKPYIKFRWQPYQIAEGDVNAAFNHVIYAVIYIRNTTLAPAVTNSTVLEK